MANIITDEHYSPEMGSGSNKKKIVVCPFCKMAISVSVNWVSGACPCSGKYFNLETSLNEDEAIGVACNRKNIDRGRVKLKAKMEKEAYEWAERNK